jgi:hypothetical protein
VSSALAPTGSRANISFIIMDGLLSPMSGCLMSYIESTVESKNNLQPRIC